MPPQPARAGATETGIASWYGKPYHGRRAASGEIYDMEQLTAAHRTLPFQTWVEVTNLTNGKKVDVRITDRGPFIDGRIIDLSLAAARQIDMVRAGVAPVRLRVIDPPDGSADDSPPPPEPAPPTAQPAAQPAAQPTTQPATPPATPPTAEPAASPPSSSPPSSSERSSYAVQAGAFADPQRARALRDSLPFPGARLLEVPGDPTLWRVVVGNNLNMDAAASLASDVKRITGEAFVVADR